MVSTRRETMTKTFKINGNTIELFVCGEDVSISGEEVFVVSKVAGSPFTFFALKSCVV